MTSTHDALTRDVAPAAADAARLLGFADVAQGGAQSARAAAPIVAGLVRATDYVGWSDAFADLAARAESPNPFMSPACVMAAKERHGADSIIVAVAREGSGPGAPLVGVWALRRIRDLWTLGARALKVPLSPDYDALSAPVLDAGRAAPALGAMIAALRAQAGAPRVIRAGSWPLSGPPLPDSVSLDLAERWERAVLQATPGAAAEDYLKAAMGGGYKKRMAQERALAREGALAHASHRGGAAVDAFERFVALEDAGWKGQAGTSLARMPADAAYMRACVRAFAAVDNVAVDLLTLDGRPVAAGLIVEAAGHSVFWKTAYDESLRRHSPGVLLDIAVTRRLFAEGRPRLDSGMMEFTDPATQVWSERLPLARAVIDCGAGAQGLAVRAGAHARHGLRRLQRALKRN